MIEQATDFEDESAALAALIAPLDEAALARPTAFKGWTVNDVIGHLYMWNWAAELSLTDEPGFLAYYAKVADHLKAGGNFRDFETHWLEGLSGRALLARWQEHFPQVAAHFLKADPKRRLKWAGPDMSARSSITARLMETWAHGQEVYDLLGATRQNTDRIRNIVILGVNTYGWSFKVRGEDAPEPIPHLRLTAPSGALWTYGEPSDTDLIEGPAEAFCQVVTQVRNIADTALQVTGPNATKWMSIAQCFAGPPQTPPAPGTRGPAPGA